MKAPPPAAPLVLTVLLGLLGPPRPAGSQAADPSEGKAPAQGQLLRPGDVIKLDIWREPEMSGEYPVDEDGLVVFPRLGTYTVTGETGESLEDRLVVDYRQYLRNPSIDVTVLRRVTILGSVAQPGLYALDPTITIADALARAGGVTSQGARDDVRIIRAGETLRTQVDERTALGDSPIRSGDQIYVPEKSWLSRNTGIVATIISGAVTVAVALLAR